MLDHSLCKRIGIDRIVLYNFEIKCLNVHKRYEEVSDEYYQEKVSIKTEIAELTSVTRLFADEKNTIKEFKQLSFNPNRILYGHNIYNSRGEELKAALDILIKHFSDNGVEIDLTNAKIAELEMNINIFRSFKELHEALLLLLIKSKRLKRISDFKKNKSLKNMFTPGSLIARWGPTACQAYDKTSEIGNEELLNEPLTRIEWTLLSRVITHLSKSLQLDLSLHGIIHNFENIEKVFRYLVLEKLKKPADKYIEMELKNNLDKGYATFKALAKQDRKIGMKERRNVYKFLEDEYWIFDYSLLEEILRRYEKKNLIREIKRIREKYIHHDGFEQLNRLVDNIFPH
ncbi:MAG: hypothetical protein ACRC51_04145 [Cetobacterium sp.]